ncbi:MAG: hypothetical protein M3P49_10115, partial [Actinomycetota bacterium]|nr:hypothetical protein [Actinomycetota bacterium]
VAAIILLVDSVLFVIAAFMPVSRVFVEPSPAAKLEIITSNRAAWSASQLLFGLGASIAAIGLGFVAYHLRGTPGAVWIHIGPAAVILGAVFWDGHVYLRAVDPEGSVEGRLIGWLFAAYALLTQFGLLAFGVAYLQAGYPAWLGGVTVGGAVIFFIVYLVFKDIPPFVYYILTFVAGIRLMQRGAWLDTVLF